MTTDFLITKKENNSEVNVARTIKSKDKLTNKRILEKFEIERIYWERKGIDWAIVTEAEMNKVIAEKISFFHSYYNIEALDAFTQISKVET